MVELDLNQICEENESAVECAIIPHDQLQSGEVFGVVQVRDGGDDGESSGNQMDVVGIDIYSTPSKQGLTESSSGGEMVTLVKTPAPGMEFSSWEELDLYYRSYGMQEGFGVVRAASGGTKNGATRQRRNQTWTCEFYGRPDRKRKLKKAGLPTDSNGVEDDEVVLSKKCDCPVKLYASVNEANMWQIRKVVNEHKNHEKPTPRKSRYISMYRKVELTKRVRRQLKLGKAAGLKPAQMHNLLALERNGLDQMGITQRDIRNENARDRLLVLKEGDAAAMLSYFDRMTADNCNFCHTYRLDNENQLQDVVWVDARSRVAYNDFCDAICFDATYLTNEYELPFANWVGVNHHGQSILLGCALISRETAETYEWVFKTWLNIMGGKAPGGILTDQCAAMRKAIAATMPDTRHRWCIWHITQKFGTKLGTHKQYEELNEALLSAIYDSLSVEEFDVNWWAVIEKYGLEGDDWLRGLYNEKEMWIPACLKHMFWAGMKTTQRVESINSFFDQYLNKHTRLFEFAEQYITAMESRAEAERQADAHDARYTRQLQYHYPAEKLFQRCYTDAKFKEVQRECKKMGWLNYVRTDKVSASHSVYVLQDRIWLCPNKSTKEYVSEYRRNYSITYDSVSDDFHCECKLFENNGICCRHMIKLWDMLSFKHVPEKYVLNRWRKDKTRKHTRVKVAYHDPLKNEEVFRLDKLQIRFDSVAERSAKYERIYKIALEELDRMDLRIEEEIKKETNDDVTIGTPNSVCIDKMGSSTQEGQKQPAVAVKDPPRKKKVAHRTTSHRFYSIVDRLKGKGKPIGKGSKGKTGKGKAKGKGKGGPTGKAGAGNGYVHGETPQLLNELIDVSRGPFQFQQVQSQSVQRHCFGFNGHGGMGHSMNGFATPLSHLQPSRRHEGALMPVTPNSGIQMFDLDGSIGFYVDNQPAIRPEQHFPATPSEYQASNTADVHPSNDMDVQLTL